MTALIEVRAASFGYKKRPVVSGVDLRVEQGDFIGILGPNGAGKTTLFRGLLGLLPPLSGTVVRTTHAIGFVPQREALDANYPLTASEVVHMGAYGRLRGLRRLPPADRSLAESCLERVGLADFGRRQFAALSGGQRQRVLIARALMVRPEVLLLDEPTSGVDAAAVEQIRELLLKLSRDEQTAILIVSHQLGVLRDAVRDVLWVAHGKVQRGRPKEMLAGEALGQLFGVLPAKTREEP